MKADSNNLAFVINSNTNKKNFSLLIHRTFKSLKQSYETKECFKDIKWIKSQRQPYSLEIVLTRAIYTNKKDHCSKKCTKIGCVSCDYIKEDRFHTFKTTGGIFDLKENMTCESCDLIYVVICSTCNEKYIGETAEGKVRVGNRVWVDQQLINQPQYQQVKCKKQFRTFGKGKLKIFPSYIRRINT